MKKILAIASSIGLYLTTTTNAFALDICPTDGLAKTICNLGTPDNAFSRIVQIIINGAFVLAIVAALGYLIYGGVKWILSQGDKSKVEGARNHVIAAIIGLVIVFMSYLILNIVVKIFTGQDLSNIELPTI